MKDFGNLDGELTEDFLNIGGETAVGLVAASATQNVYPNMNDDDESFEGDYFSSFDHDFSDATGKRRKRIKRRDARRKSRLDTRKSRQKSRLDTKKSKDAERLARAELTKSLTKDKQSDVDLAKALSADVNKTPSNIKKPMTTTTKVLIGLGVLIGIAAIGFGIYKLKTRK
jgi:hypothetical protein